MSWPKTLTEFLASTRGADNAAPAPDVTSETLARLRKERDAWRELALMRGVLITASGNSLRITSSEARRSREANDTIRRLGLDPYTGERT